MLADCTSIHRAWDAVLLLGDVQAGAGTSMLERTTRGPSVRTVSYTADGQTQAADLYRSADVSRGPLVLVHGMARRGWRDARLVDFAQTLARSGFVVLVPRLPGLADMSVGSAERVQIATALRFVTRCGCKTGLAAMSLASGPALQAAMKTGIAPHVSYIVLVGPYYDIVELIRYATTGVTAADAEARPIRQAVRVGRWMLLRSQLRHLERPEDRLALDRIAERKLADAQAPVHDLLSRLSPHGRALYDLIVNEDPGRVEPLIAQLPQILRAELDALDLANKDLSALQARLLLIHGERDPVIPLGQSRQLAEAVGAGQATLVAPQGLEHVDLVTTPRAIWPLLRAAYSLLALGEATAASPASCSIVSRTPGPAC